MTAQQANADQIAYWNGVAGQKWVTAQDRLDTMLEAFSDRLLAEANTRSGERVLDIGCGCGATTVSLSKAGAIPTGLDISEPMLARARHRAPGHRVPRIRRSNA
jgi:2-polyprenyl-3-methyl-5-hydroxy-6-metoxy-1,4-benzoquinol methylase